MLYHISKLFCQARETINSDFTEFGATTFVENFREDTLIYLLNQQFFGLI